MVPVSDRGGAEAWAAEPITLGAGLLPHVPFMRLVAADGRPRDIRVARSLGMGLDEKAIEAVRTWRFEPARKDGNPVAVQINVEVSFRLY